MQQAAPVPIIAIVDDDDSVRRALRRLLRSMSFDPVDFPSGEAFLADLDRVVFQCAILDLQMPGLNGIEVMQRLRLANLAVPTIIVTASTDPDLHAECLAAGAAAFLCKPLSGEQLLETLRTTLAR